LGLRHRVLAGLDIARGIELYGGKEKTYLKVLRSYAASSRFLLKGLEDFKEDSIYEYKTKVHGIKGTSSSIFAGQISELATRLENAAKNNDLDYIRKNNKEFIDSTSLLMDEIEAMLNEIDTENPKPVKDKPDEELLSMLIEACSSYIVDDVEKLIDRIDEYRYNDDDGLVDWLKHNIDMMHYGKIVEKLSEIV